jgi:very-short-patch-repair endonuclease
MHPNFLISMIVGTAHQDPLVSNYFVQRQRARRLRKNMTDAERKLWRHIRDKQLHQIQFYRQRPLGPFIADFWAPTIGLVIEVDGGQHFGPEGRRSDARRDAWFRRRGLRVVRYDNVQVLTEIEAVLRDLLAVMDEQLVDSLRSHPP